MKQMNLSFQSGVMFLPVIVLVLFMSCIPDRGGLLNDSIRYHGKWVDDHLYRITITGRARSISNKEDRKSLAVNDSIARAQKRIISEFRRQRYGGFSPSSEYDVDGTKIPAEIFSIVKAGTIKQITWQSESKCEIVYEIFAHQLRNKVLTAEW